MLTACAQLSTLLHRQEYVLVLHIYLFMKEGSFVLFCSYEIQQTRMLQIMFLVSSEIMFLVSLEIMFLVSSESSLRGVHGLGSMTIGLEVQKFLNVE